MPVGGRFREWRFSKSALYVSASALCLPSSIGAALAGPVENTPFISVYGGYLFNEGESNLDFVGISDPSVDEFGELHPGQDGGMGGIEFGRPLSPAWDIRASLTGAAFSEDESQDSTGAGGAASNRLNFEYLDLELGYRPGVLADRIRLFAGPRILRSDNDIDYSVDEASSKVGTYDRDVELWAGGARVGGQGSLPLGSRASLSLLGAGSALVARSEQTYAFDFVGTGGAFGTGSGSDSESYWRGVYSLEAVAAANVALNDRVELSVGYQVQQWWNLTTTIEDVGSGDTEISDTGEGDLLVHGPVARITVKLGQ